jgi:hypothetical protein
MQRFRELQAAGRLDTSDIATEIAAARGRSV